MFCPHCGVSSVESARFCVRCGRELSNGAVNARAESDALDDVPISPEILRLIEGMIETDEPAEYNQFFERLRDITSLTASDFDKIVTVAEHQYCIWHTSWLFSPSSAPDGRALEQANGWKRIYDAFSKQFSEILPDVGPLLERRLPVQLAGEVMKSKAEYDRVNGLSGLSATLRHFWARRLDDVGLRTSAERTIHKGLFPPGSVGSDQKTN
jgi:hypothetical protein